MYVHDVSEHEQPMSIVFVNFAPGSWLELLRALDADARGRERERIICDPQNPKTPKPQNPYIGYIIVWIFIIECIVMNQRFYFDHNFLSCIFSEEYSILFWISVFPLVSLTKKYENISVYDNLYNTNILQPAKK